MSYEYEDKLGEPSPTLAVRLSPRQARGERLVGTCLIAVFLIAVVAVVAYAYYQLPDSENDSRLVAIAWLAPLGIVALLAILLLWSAIRQGLALTVPMTIVEVDKQPISPGDSLVICVKQPGPLHLKSLRLNLIGSQQNVQRDDRPGEIEQRRAPSKSVLQANILDAGRAWIRGSGYRQWTCSFEVPGDVTPSGRVDSVTTSWTLELWGVGNFGLIGFFYQFPIKVSLRDS